MTRRQVSPLILERAGDFIGPLAVNVHRSYPAVPTEDVMQELWLWFCENPAKADEYLSDDDVRKGERMLSTALLNRGRAYAIREKAARGGYEVDDVVFYSLAEIEELIPQVYDVECWVSPPQRGREEGMPASKTDPAHGGGHLASLVDVGEAIRKCDARTREALDLVYLRGYNQRSAATVMGMAESSMSELLARAPRKIQRQLGGARPDGLLETVGSRRVRGNAAAQAETGAGYDGD